MSEERRFQGSKSSCSSTDSPLDPLWESLDKLDLTRPISLRSVTGGGKSGLAVNCEYPEQKGLDHDHSASTHKDSRRLFPGGDLDFFELCWFDSLRFFPKGGRQNGHE